MQSDGFFLLIELDIIIIPEENLAVVLRRDSVIYGGTDVTQNVIAGLKK